jgi:hypothetical protein
MLRGQTGKPITLNVYSSNHWETSRKVIKFLALVLMVSWLFIALGIKAAYAANALMLT